MYCRSDYSEGLWGDRLETPLYMPNPLGTLMVECWKDDPKERPPFTRLEREIGNLVTWWETMWKTTILKWMILARKLIESTYTHQKDRKLKK